MINYTWKPLELFASENQLVSVRYHITGSDEEHTVESEGSLIFNVETVSKPLADIVESDLIQWIEKDTTVDGINPIKSNIENKLNSLKIAKTLAIGKVDFPWLANTLTVE